MFLVYAELNRQYTITRILGNDRLHLHLQKMGFTVGSQIKLISKLNGNPVFRNLHHKSLEPSKYNDYLKDL